MLSDFYGKTAGQKIRNPQNQKLNQNRSDSAAKPQVKKSETVLIKSPAGKSENPHPLRGWVSDLIQPRPRTRVWRADIPNAPWNAGGAS